MFENILSKIGEKLYGFAEWINTQSQLHARDGAQAIWDGIKAAFNAVLG